MSSELVNKTYHFAKAAHEGQKYGEHDYFTHHILGVVSILTNELGVTDSTAIAAALLHDVVEDCGIPLKFIAEKFGIAVAQHVKDLTHTCDSYQHYVQGIAAIGGCSTMVKFADSLFNYRSCIASGDTKRATKYFYNLEVLLNESTIGLFSNLENC
jgi:hypothetical protein